MGGNRNHQSGPGRARVTDQVFPRRARVAMGGFKEPVGVSRQGAKPDAETAVPLLVPHYHHTQLRINPQPGQSEAKRPLVGKPEYPEKTTSLGCRLEELTCSEAVVSGCP